jgi:hypothetical protein
MKRLKLSGKLLRLQQFSAACTPACSSLQPASPPARIITPILVSSLSFCLSILFQDSFATTPEFDAAKAFSQLKKQCSFGPRNPGSAGYKQCLSWMEAELKAAGAEVYLQRFEGIDGRTGVKLKLTNVAARIGKEGAAPLMLCAHWDTRPVADREKDPARQKQPIPGANDGASGVAVLLEIARIARNNPPPRPVILVFFDGEDLGREGQNDEYAQGSRYWAKHPLPERPAEAILLDMVGDRDLQFTIELFSEAGAKSLRRAVWEVAASLGVEEFVDETGPAIEDDHVPLLRAGIPAIDIIDFDYPYWHTLDDTPDKCSAESLGAVGRVLVEYIYR